MTGTTDKEVVFVVGAGLLLCALILFRHTRKFIKCAVLTDGEVVGFGEESVGDGFGRRTAAIIVYTVNRKKYTFPATIVSKKRFHIGRKISVLYDPKNPSDANLDNLYHLFYLEVMVAIVGLSMTIAGVFGY